MPVGQVIGSIRDIPPAAEIVYKMVDQAEQTMKGLCKAML